MKPNLSASVVIEPQRVTTPDGVSDDAEVVPRRTTNNHDYILSGEG